MLKLVETPFDSRGSLSWCGKHSYDSYDFYQVPFMTMVPTAAYHVLLCSSSSDLGFRCRNVSNLGDLGTQLRIEFKVQKFNSFPSMMKRRKVRQVSRILPIGWGSSPTSIVCSLGTLTSPRLVSQWMECCLCTNTQRTQHRYAQIVCIVRCRFNMRYAVPGCPRHRVFQGPGVWAPLSSLCDVLIDSSTAQWFPLSKMDER